MINFESKTNNCKNIYELIDLIIEKRKEDAE
jgi:hypothetical protein